MNLIIIKSIVFKNTVEPLFDRNGLGNGKKRREQLHVCFMVNNMTSARRLSSLHLTSRNNHKVKGRLLVVIKGERALMEIL